MAVLMLAIVVMVFIITRLLSSGRNAMRNPL
jgi:hypothetical protein